MTWTIIDRLDEHGVVKDVPPQALPMNAWTDGNNVRFSDGAARKTRGYEETFPNSLRPPYYILSGKFNDASDFWIYSSSDDGTNWYVNAVLSGAHTDITRATLSGTVTTTQTLQGNEENVWTGSIFNNNAILNNGSNRPMHWVSSSSRIDLLTNATFTCASLRAFKNFLVAVDVTKGGTRDPNMVKWSDSATTSSDPSWDETEQTKDAGEVVLSETPDICIDSLTLRDIHIVYKEHSTWGMQFVGHPFIFRFYNISRTEGILSRNCAIEANGVHIVLTRDDVMANDGQSMRSIIDHKWRRQLFSEMDPTYAPRSFIAADHQNSQIWICYPVVGPFPDTALVWDWRNNTWGKKDLATMSSAVYGPSHETGGTWDADADTWADDSSPWEEIAGNAFIGASPEQSKFYVLNITEQSDGVNQTAFVERKALSFGDPYKRKLIRKIRLYISGTDGGTINIKVGHHTLPDETPTYPASGQGSVLIPSSGTLELDVFVNGYFIAVHVSSNTNIEWVLHGYSLDGEVASGY